MPPEKLPANHPAAPEVQRRTVDLQRTLRAVVNEALGAPEACWLNAGLREHATLAADTLRQLLAGTAELAAQAARVESARRAREGDDW